MKLKPRENIHPVMWLLYVMMFGIMVTRFGWLGLVGSIVLFALHAPSSILETKSPFWPLLILIPAPIFWLFEGVAIDKLYLYGLTMIIACISVVQRMKEQEMAN